MTITYHDLRNSDNKLAILLHRLSYPKQNSAEYWEHWAQTPLHKYVFAIIRGLTEHRIRIMRLQREQEHIKQQFAKLESDLLIPEDVAKIQKFLHREYLNLVHAEKKELAGQLAFLQEQMGLIGEELENASKKHADEWKKLFKEQFKLISKEMKSRGLDKELKELKRKLES